MSKVHRQAALILHVALMLASSPSVWAQHAGLSGVVRDAQGGVVANANIRLVEQATAIVRSTKSNAHGIYVFASVRPSTYRLEVEAPGFALAVLADLDLHVDERTAQDVALVLEGRAEEIQVRGTGPLLGTLDGSVGTVIDRRFAADLPVRGRSFSALVGLVPGVSRIPGALASGSGSEFTVNGQRDTSNTLTVDGTSGLSELDAGGMANAAGQRFSSTQMGTVNGGVSMDAVQEIRVQTSSFAAEFGRTPGAQISLVTRSGTNRLSGALFEQFRNEDMMANDWFANSRGVAKGAADEHQFGAVLGGPIVRNRLFFFASYEGVRLDRPRFVVANVPSLEAREQNSRVREILAVYPLPTGPTQSSLTAEHAAFYTQHHSSDTWGGRVDQVLAPGVQLFGRYSRVPSTLRDEYPLAVTSTLGKEGQSLTGGLSAALGARFLLDVRANYGDSDYGYASSAGESLRAWFPASVPAAGQVTANITGLAGVYDGDAGDNVQRQSNIVGSLSYVGGAHQVKVGVDYRRLQPKVESSYSASVDFASVTQALTATSVPLVSVFRTFPIHVVFENVSLYVQDTWRVRPRLSVTYGARWDINPPPSFGKGEGPLAAVTFEPVTSLEMASTQDLPLWDTNLGNVFPRFGFSYALDANARTMLTGGGGLFGDLEGPATSAALGLRVSQSSRTNVTLPLQPEDVAGVDRPALVPPFASRISAVDPHLSTPRTLQWSLAVERALGGKQAISLTYVGARGSNLLQARSYPPRVTPDFAGGLSMVAAIGRSKYQSLQVQYRARTVANVHALASYALADSRDTTSTLVAADTLTALSPSNNDLRHSFSMALSWEVPSSEGRPFTWLLRNWSVQAVGLARSGYPFSVQAAAFVVGPDQQRSVARASFVPGVPIVIEDASAPGGRRFNRDAFTNPPAGAQGDTGRNAFRGFSAYQLDLAIQRAIPLGGGATLRLRLDAFNAFNTPVFALPDQTISSSSFGRPTEMAVSGLGALYQSGGPRSFALSTRVEF